jgi:hypothetical protein
MTASSSSESQRILVSEEEAAQERRRGLHLFDYWMQLCNGREFPHEDEVIPEEIRALWDDCFLIQRRDIENVPHYNYTYLGGNIRAAYESGHIQSHIPGLVSLSALHLAGEFGTVIGERRPYFFEHAHRLTPTHVVRFRQCLLPLGDAHGDVASILGEMRFRIYEERE